MKKPALLTFLFFIISFIAYSQSKMNPALLKKIDKADKRAGASIGFFIKGDIPAIKTEVIQNGGTFKYSSGNIAVIELPAEQIRTLADKPFVTRMESAGDYRPVVLADSSIRNSNVWQVHSGLSPLSKKYTGKGVIVGILDTGVDFDHPDFKDTTGNTRIKYIWDQRVNDTTGTTPADYGYGTVWDSIKIENGQCTHIDNCAGGHGTNVTGIAAGNGLATGNLRGMAPESDIIVVAVNGICSSSNYGNWLLDLVDGVDYIFKKADILGKPCVVNISLGTFNGPHDGKDLASQMMEAMLQEKTGRAITVAAGNSGHIPFHLNYPVTPDSSFTWFKSFNSGGARYVYFNLWADTGQFENVEFAFGADDPSKSLFRGMTGYQTLDSSFNQYYSDTLYNNTNRLGVIQTYTDLSEGRYQTEVIIIVDSTTYDWRFITKGNGSFDIWSSRQGESWTGSSSMIVKDSAFLSANPDYKNPDQNSTLTGHYACSPEIITVGNYVNRQEYTDARMNQQILGFQEKDRYYKSSRGPTRTGILKPDLTTPGNFTLVPAAAGKLASLDSSQLAIGGMHMLMTGTSISSPATAGICALYFEKNPDASHLEIIDALQSSARQDTFTGFSLPDNSWGYGKADAFQMLQLQKGCIDSLALNYDPAAGLDDGSCCYAVSAGFSYSDSLYSVKFTNTTLESDSLYWDFGDGSNDTTFNPVHIYGDTGTYEVCLYASNACDMDTFCQNITIGSPNAVIDKRKEEIYLNIYPNPFRNTANIEYHLPDHVKNTAFHLFNVLGVKVISRQLLNNKKNETLNINNLPPGIYFYQLDIGEGGIKTGKVTVY